MQRIVITWLLLLLSTSALAHSVYIFAWIDGGQICTESYFTKKNKVRGGDVLMQTSTGETLAQTTSGEDGLACFPLPDKAEQLNFVILAGAGHRGQFSLAASEVRAAVNNNTPKRVPVSKQTQSLPTNTPLTATSATIATDLAASQPPAVIEVSQAQLRAIVHDELQKQLSPLRQYIAEKFEDNTPGIKEIIGGIGWLVGLGAIGYWFAQRRKKGQ